MLPAYPSIKDSALLFHLTILAAFNDSYLLFHSGLPSGGILIVLFLMYVLPKIYKELSFHDDLNTLEYRLHRVHSSPLLTNFQKSKVVPENPLNMTNEL